MRKASIGIAPEGMPIIGLMTVFSIAFACLRWDFPTLICLVLLWFSVYFFRDPERVVPTGKGLAVSPADGKVIRIRDMEDPFTGKMRPCMSIFMNVFSVHVNRTPVSGTIEGIRYYPGKFINAAYDKASTDNERCAYSLNDREGQNWVFVQISGLIARRIVCRTEEGDSLNRGERFGMIRFGSRVDLFLPEGYIPSVGIGEQVFAGQTVVAKKAD